MKTHILAALIAALILTACGSVIDAASYREERYLIQQLGISCEQLGLSRFDCMAMGG